MSKIFAALATATAMMATSAQAEVFNGGYVGVQTGWEQNKLDEPFSITTSASKKSGLSYGAIAGYDVKVGEQFVVGGEAGLGFTTGSDQVTVGTSSARLKPQRSFDLTARAGFLAAPDSLFYVRTGYSNARFKLEETIGGLKATTHDTSEGWLLGGGLEHAFTEKVTGRVEYRHTDFEGPSNRRHQVLVGMAYHF